LFCFKIDATNLDKKSNLQVSPDIEIVIINSGKEDVNEKKEVFFEKVLVVQKKVVNLHRN
jgi:hypothetical protein